jgi:hypothetical protein
MRQFCVDSPVMSPSMIDAIERQIRELPRQEQRHLMERLVQRLSGTEARDSPAHGWTASLEDMARDPEIVRECGAMETHFGPTELDGLRSR